MKKHLKRRAAPLPWHTTKKTDIWITRPRPGPHPMEVGVPLQVVIRDMLGYCDTATEARKIIGGREILVDGKVVTDYKRPIGFMDVLSIPKTKEHFRVVLDSKGHLQLSPITKDRAKWKLVRIEDKTMVKGGRIQLNLHDGRNILLKKDQYKTKDVLKIELPSQKILDSFSFSSGNMAVVMGGRHAGEMAPIKSTEVTRSPKPNYVQFAKGFSTIQNYVFVVGKKDPEIALFKEDASKKEAPKKETPKSAKETEEKVEEKAEVKK